MLTIIILFTVVAFIGVFSLKLKSRKEGESKQSVAESTGSVILSAFIQGTTWALALGAAATILAMASAPVFMGFVFMTSTLVMGIVGWVLIGWLMGFFNGIFKDVYGKHHYQIVVVDKK